jgi:hypothetical protein
MDIARKDAAAGVLVALAVAALAATSQGWGVPLIGASHRWAAAAILLLGVIGCALGSPGDMTHRSAATTVLFGLGAVALGLGVVALVTGSLTALTLLVAVTVSLWVAAATRHRWGHLHHPAAVT